PIIFTGTRWHEDDPQARILADEGRLEDGGAWHVVHMPALADLTLTGGTDPLGRADGDPLPHPKVESGPKERERLLTFWRRRKASTRARGWHSLYQGNPKPSEGAMVSRALLRALRVPPGQAAPPRITAVALDPSGGGRDEAGIIAGYLGGDNRLYLTHDRTGRMGSGTWARAVCELAATVDADRIVVEENFGGDQPKTILGGAWKLLRRKHEGQDQDDDVVNPYARPMPRIVRVRAKKGKQARADLAVSQMEQDRVRIVGVLADLEEEWATWNPVTAAANSPGRIDASVYLVFELIRPEGTEAVIMSPANVTVDQVAGSGWASTSVNEVGLGGGW
ncbi:hypothetical protein ACFVP2_39450, partial [Streptomyces alboflavus]